MDQNNENNVHLKQLIELCEGLEIQNISELLSQKPEIFKALGKEFTKRIRKLKEEIRS